MEFDNIIFLFLLVYIFPALLILFSLIYLIFHKVLEYNHSLKLLTYLYKNIKKELAFLIGKN